MGYYTAYNLKVQNATRDELDKIVNALKDRGVIGYALDEDLDCYDAVKWYDHDADMLAVSVQFPDLLFCLHGEGDDSGDLWNKYYQDGKMQECYAEIVYPEFNPTKLRLPPQLK